MSTDEPVRQRYLHRHGGEQLVHDVVSTPLLPNPQGSRLSIWLTDVAVASVIKLGFLFLTRGSCSLVDAVL